MDGGMRARRSFRFKSLLPPFSHSLSPLHSYLFEIGGAAAADVDGLSLLRNELFFSKGILAPSSRSSLPLANLSFFGHSQTLTFNSSSSFALPT